MIGVDTVYIGDTVECDVRQPYLQTYRVTLLTEEAVAFATDLLARPNTPWRKVPHEVSG